MHDTVGCTKQFSVGYHPASGVMISHATLMASIIGFPVPSMFTHAVERGGTVGESLGASMGGVTTTWRSHDLCSSSPRVGTSPRDVPRGVEAGGCLCLSKPISTQSGWTTESANWIQALQQGLSSWQDLIHPLLSRAATDPTLDKSTLMSRHRLSPQHVFTRDHGLSRVHQGASIPT